MALALSQAGSPGQTGPRAEGNPGLASHTQAPAAPALCVAVLAVGPGGRLRTFRLRLSGEGEFSFLFDKPLGPRLLSHGVELAGTALGVGFLYFH